MPKSKKELCLIGRVRMDPFGKERLSQILYEKSPDIILLDMFNEEEIIRKKLDERMEKIVEKSIIESLIQTEIKINDSQKKEIKNCFNILNKDVMSYSLKASQEYIIDNPKTKLKFLNQKKEAGLNIDEEIKKREEYLIGTFLDSSRKDYFKEYFDKSPETKEMLINLLTNPEFMKSLWERDTALNYVKYELSKKPGFTDQGFVEWNKKQIEYNEKVISLIYNKIQENYKKTKKVLCSLIEIENLSTIEFMTRKFNPEVLSLGEGRYEIQIDDSINGQIMQ